MRISDWSSDVCSSDLAAHARLAAQADFVLVEGVGGWLAPLSATLDQPDLVRALDLPVVLVVGMRLGCLNHSRLSARAIEDDGARLAGWIASEVDPDMARRDQNFDALRSEEHTSELQYLLRISYAVFC